MQKEDLVHLAFDKLYGEGEMGGPQLSLRFSGRFSDYNGNVSIKKVGRHINALEFSLSKKFLDTEDDMVIGIIQHLLNKVHGTKENTMEQELYHGFIRHLNRYVKHDTRDELLSELFGELTEEYFGGLLDEPNMTFGGENTTTLGHYNYSKDLVTISSALREDRELLKYVLYHELLHKKHSFKTTNGRSHYHTPAFRRDEKNYHDKHIEKKLEEFLYRKRRSNHLASRRRTRSVAKQEAEPKRKRRFNLLDWI